MGKKHVPNHQPVLVSCTADSNPSWNHWIHLGPPGVAGSCRPSTARRPSRAAKKCGSASLYNAWLPSYINETLIHKYLVNMDIYIYIHIYISFIQQIIWILYDIIITIKSITYVYIYIHINIHIHMNFTIDIDGHLMNFQSTSVFFLYISSFSYFIIFQGKKQFHGNNDGFSCRLSFRFHRTTTWLCVKIRYPKNWWY